MTAELHMCPPRVTRALAVHALAGTLRRRANRT